MNKTWAKRWIIGFSLLFGLVLNLQSSGFGATAVVHAVFFYSPTCPHCHEVIEDVLKPLRNQYGEQLAIVAVNVRDPRGQGLYRAAIKHFSIAEDRVGVPTLIVDEQVMVGALEIPQQFPQLITTMLAQGGSPLPPIAGLMDTTKNASPGVEKNLPDKQRFGVFQKITLDPIGNSLAIVMLIMMATVLVYTLSHFSADMKHAPHQSLGWPVPAIAVLGLGIAGYMGYVESAQVMAVCGPVGDCNTVQQSKYAELFGIPLGILGIGGYLLILGAWLLARFSETRLAALSTLAIFGIALGGTLFSVYLTFLEPFVIGATCAWCLGSALCMTLLLLFTRKAAAAAFEEIIGSVTA
ncbi:MAG: vitamin K epoxide reductase family protein [Candidatus Competibacteraceae bacterium]|jgi:uncharacterized membrane protein/thiol-disulfide isomerase/thioredoxin|nr:vitamin K epoxide reductase family protein [Candidatus Competibacteraceae bacterium]